MRRLVAAILFAISCISLDLTANVESWPSWETPASQAEDALTDQPWIATDVANKVLAAIVPIPSVDSCILADAPVAGLCIACTGDLTRAPPSA